jgi:hypothetical protein
MYKLEIKTKHKARKKRKMQQQTQLAEHLLWSPLSPEEGEKKKPVSSLSPAGQTQSTDHHLQSKPSLKNRL